jgi:hypothetical protein
MNALFKKIHFFYSIAVLLIGFSFGFHYSNDDEDVFIEIAIMAGLILAPMIISLIFQAFIEPIPSKSENDAFDFDAQIGNLTDKSDD